MVKDYHENRKTAWHGSKIKRYWNFNFFVNSITALLHSCFVCAMLKTESRELRSNVFS